MTSFDLPNKKTAFTPRFLEVVSSSDSKSPTPYPNFIESLYADISRNGDPIASTIVSKQEFSGLSALFD